MSYVCEAISALVHVAKFAGSAAKATAKCLVELCETTSTDLRTGEPEVPDVPKKINKKIQINLFYTFMFRIFVLSI